MLAAMSWEISAHAGVRRASGLLLLRLGLTLTFLLLAQGAGPAVGGWPGWPAAALATGLVLGALSCPCAAGALIWGALAAPPAPQGLVWILAAQALAVMLLGAGRWSVDRRLFGRRLVFSSDDTFG